MNYHTVIDTVKVQVDFDTALEQQEALNTLIQTLATTGAFIFKTKRMFFQEIILFIAIKRLLLRSQQDHLTSKAVEL